MTLITDQCAHTDNSAQYIVWQHPALLGLTQEPSIWGLGLCIDLLRLLALNIVKNCIDITCTGRRDEQARTTKQR